jgi:hypothetical protein
MFDKRSRLFFLSALFLSLFSFPALGQKFAEARGGEWIELGRNESARAYLDQRSFQRNGDMARVYQLTDFVTAQWVDERTVMGSIRALVEYDCSRSRMRTLALEAYSEQMGEGRLIGSEQNPDAEWENLAEGNSSARAYELACR